MANPRLLPDTCAWIDFFRGADSEPARFLEQALRGSATVCVCGPILYELVQGVRSEKEGTAIINALEGLVALEVTDTLWIGAAFRATEETRNHPSQFGHSHCRRGPRKRSHHLDPRQTFFADSPPGDDGHTTGNRAVTPLVGEG